MRAGNEAGEHAGIDRKRAGKDTAATAEVERAAHEAQALARRQAGGAVCIDGGTIHDMRAAAWHIENAADVERPGTGEIAAELPIEVSRAGRERAVDYEVAAWLGGDIAAPLVGTRDGVKRA